MSQFSAGASATGRRRERLEFQLHDGSRVEGVVTIPRKATRTSDHMNEARDFYSLQDASIIPAPGTGQEREEVPFLLLARLYVKLIRVIQEEAPDPPGA